MRSTSAVATGLGRTARLRRSLLRADGPGVREIPIGPPPRNHGQDQNPNQRGDHRPQHSRESVPGYENGQEQTLSEPNRSRIAPCIIVLVLRAFTDPNSTRTSLQKLFEEVVSIVVYIFVP